MQLEEVVMNDGSAYRWIVRDRRSGHRDLRTWGLATTIARANHEALLSAEAFRRSGRDVLVEIVPVRPRFPSF